MWGEMFKQLDGGDYWIAGDYSNYDKTLSYQCARGFLQLASQFYDEDDETCEILFETMYSAFHLAGREVYRVYQGNPSGVVLTTVMNTVVN